MKLPSLTAIQIGQLGMQFAQSEPHPMHAVLRNVATKFPERTRQGLADGQLGSPGRRHTWLVPAHLNVAVSKSIPPASVTGFAKLMLSMLPATV
jgi:hypothetical protein